MSDDERMDGWVMERDGFILNVDLNLLKQGFSPMNWESEAYEKVPKYVNEMDTPPQLFRSIEAIRASLEQMKLRNGNKKFNWSIEVTTMTKVAGFGRDIWTQSPLVKFKLGQSVPTQRIFVTGGFHPREWFAIESVLLLIHHLHRLCVQCDLGNEYAKDTLQPFIDQSTEIWIVPVVNLFGFLISISGPHRAVIDVTPKSVKEREAARVKEAHTSTEGAAKPSKFPAHHGEGSCRANRTTHIDGVDLNRNFPVFWGNDDGSSGRIGDDDYRGPRAASEPETNAIIKLLEMFKPTLTIDVHSFGKFIPVLGGMDPKLLPADKASMKKSRWLADRAPGIMFGPSHEHTGPKDIYCVSGSFEDCVAMTTDSTMLTMEIGAESFSSDYIPEQAEKMNMPIRFVNLLTTFITEFPNPQ